MISGEAVSVVSLTGIDFFITCCSLQFLGSWRFSKHPFQHQKRINGQDFHPSSFEDHILQWHTPAATRTIFRPRTPIGQKSMVQPIRVLNNAQHFQAIQPQITQVQQIRLQRQQTVSQVQQIRPQGQQIVPQVQQIRPSMTPTVRQIRPQIQPIRPKKCNPGDFGQNSKPNIYQQILDNSSKMRSSSETVMRSEFLHEIGRSIEASTLKAKVPLSYSFNADIFKTINCPICEQSSERKVSI